MNLPPYPVPAHERPPCREDPDLFFDAPRSKDNPGRIAAAKALCARCPFRAACADYATYRDVEGVWGQLDEYERKAIRRRAGIVPAPIVTNPQRKAVA